jgi:hypothetical protein
MTPTMPSSIHSLLFPNTWNETYHQTLMQAWDGKLRPLGWMPNGHGTQERLLNENQALRT